MDLGNSFVKIGFFSQTILDRVERLHWDDFWADHTLLANLSSCQGIISSVLSVEQNEQIRAYFPHFLFLDAHTLCPISVDYHTPSTLGYDRLCNVVGAWRKNEHANSLVIDIGTCLKVDFIAKNGHYMGGSISPGLHMRYRALHDYTANLPMLTTTDACPLIGKSTQECIQSGVINGIRAEIDQFIVQYEHEYELLTIFVTGGDAQYVYLQTKKNIFAHPHLTLLGLYEIFLFNA